MRRGAVADAAALASYLGRAGHEHGDVVQLLFLPLAPSADFLENGESLENVGLAAKISKRSMAREYLLHYFIAPLPVDKAVRLLLESIEQICHPSALAAKS